VILMTDLDLGMNDHITDPLVWDDTRVFDRGKVLTSTQLDAIYAHASSGNGNGYLLGTQPPSAATDDASSDVNGGNETFAGGTGDAGEGARAPAEDLEAAGAELEQFKGKYGRYLDIDNDGIPYRTIPGTHATRGAFVTRGSSRDEYAVYTEDADAYQRFVD